VGIEELEEGMGTIFPFEGREAFLCLTTQSPLLGLILHLPGKEEIGPVDIGRHIGNIVRKYHISNP